MRALESRIRNCAAAARSEPARNARRGVVAPAPRASNRASRLGGNAGQRLSLGARRRRRLSLAHLRQVRSMARRSTLERGHRPLSLRDRLSAFVTRRAVRRAGAKRRSSTRKGRPADDGRAARRRRSARGRGQRAWHPLSGRAVGWTENGSVPRSARASRCRGRARERTRLGLLQLSRFVRAAHGVARHPRHCARPFSGGIAARGAKLRSQWTLERRARRSQRVRVPESQATSAGAIRHYRA